MNARMLDWIIVRHDDDEVASFPRLHHRTVCHQGVAHQPTGGPNHMVSYMILDERVTYLLL